MKYFVGPITVWVLTIIAINYYYKNILFKEIILESKIYSFLMVLYMIIASIIFMFKQIKKYLKI